jgi:predicted methyltransferase
MRNVLLLVLLVACKKTESPTPAMRASCAPDSNFETMTCTVENVGKVRSRACVTAREQVPKSRPLVAQRVCTKSLEPGEKLTFRPKFELHANLAPVCAPDGTWICRDEIVETPEMLTQNLPAAEPVRGSGSAVTVDAALVPPPYTPAADVPEVIKQVIAAADRAVEDRMLDAGRKPGEVLGFFGVKPGMKIGELFAGGGYTTELMARIVGDTGKIWAQNSKDILDRFARKPWTERAAKPVMKNVVGVEKPIDDPFPPEAKDLDMVITILNYHDAVWQKADRPKMNKRIFDALKKGGVYAIVDHSAAAGSGVRDVETLHRIDEEVVKQEVLAAGFKLDASSDVLRNPADTRDWNSSPRAAAEKRGTSDRFTLRFVKP